MEKIELLKSVNERLYEQISFAETKNGVIFAFGSAMIAFAMQTLLDYYDNISTILLIYVYIFLFFMGLCMMFGMISFFPKTTSSKDNILSWKTISSYKEYADYSNVVESHFKDNMDSSLAIIEMLKNQNYTLSTIVARKHHYFIRSIMAVSCAFFPPLLGYFAIRCLIKCFKG